MTADAPAGLAMRNVSLAYRNEETRKPETNDTSHKFISLLENADWFLNSGEQVALCGPSGCGKTSLLNVLAGLEKPVSGSIRWDNIEITSITAQQQDTWRRNQLGLVFQQFHLFPNLSAIENVLLPTRFTAIHPNVAQRERAQSLLARVGVRANVDIAVLSRGEQQRVAVARALLSSPHVVLADEPTASLDHDTARTIACMLRELCREQRTTLIVATHDREIASTFDAIYDMANGKITLRDISQ